jgi:hypothetical protein
MSKQADADVSPMAAQNEGPAHKGPTSEPEPATRTAAAEKKDEAPESPIKKGGEAARDDA